jgi:hypothetical protein
MTKNFLLGLAGVAMLVGCQHNCGCRSCGSNGTGAVQTMSQVPASPSTTSLAGRSMQQGGQPTSAQVLGAQQQQTTSQSNGLIMPNAMSSKPGNSDMMSR